MKAECKVAQVASFSRFAGFAGVLGSLLMVFFWFSPKAYGQSADEGRAIFTQNCTTCHRIGGGVLVGPDLKGVARRRDRNWLLRMIKEPDKLIAEKDPIVMQLMGEHQNIQMPRLPLSDEQVESLILYLEEESGIRRTSVPAEAPPATVEVPTAPSAPIQGDYLIGREYFEGKRRFKNGAPACIGCHSAGKLGVFGGGALGPNLTKAYSKYGKDGIVTIMSSLPFPTMRPIFVNRPLTPEEQAHLAAFFAEIDKHQALKLTGRVSLISFVVFLGLVGAFQAIWWKRLTQVRVPLIRKVYGRKSNNQH